MLSRRLSTLTFLVVWTMTVTQQGVQGQLCTLCNVGSPRNVNLEIPFLILDEREEALTCGALAEFAAAEVLDGSELCTIIQAHSDYCGCAGGIEQNLCPLCADGATPENLLANTAFDASCDILDVYLRFLPGELCATDRVQTMRLADEFCGCPGAVSDCHMCSDDTNDLAFGDRAVPFWDPSMGLTTPQFRTCQFLADSSFLLISSGSCNQVQGHDNYCGCSDATGPLNACTLCPDGSTPEDGTRDIPALGMTCAELDVFVRHYSPNQCDAGAAERYQLFDYYCGCPGAMPHCPICVNDNSADMAHPDRIVPFLELLDDDNPTCLFLATLGAITDLESDICSLIQAQGDFCGCPGATIPNPNNGCLYCDSGLPPANGDKITQFGDTCNELATYVSFLPPEECGSTRVQLIKQTDFSCGCPGATTSCPLCDDGTFDVAFPDRHIPLLALPEKPDATCQDVIDLLIFHDEATAGDPCEDLKEYSGYCGCANSQPINACSFCPGGEDPANGDLVVSGLFTCNEMNEFVANLDAEGCARGNNLERIQNFAFTCGCPNTEPACTLCPDGSQPLNGNDIVAGDGRTCNDFARQVETFSEQLCADTERQILVAASTCECPGVEFPQCTIQQNAELCTVELLESTDEDCPCYAFCDDQFVRCQSPEGGVLRADECAGTPISGCNMAGAVGGPDAPGESATPVRHVMVPVLSLTTLLAVLLSQI